MNDRDHFAAAALSGLMANQTYDREDPYDMAAIAYDIADAMLLERDDPQAQNGSPTSCASVQQEPAAKPTLTDAEREAVEVAVFLVGLGDDSLHAATLRGLLERL